MSAEIITQHEIACIKALADLGIPLSQDERDAFRLGFLAGASQALEDTIKRIDALREET